MDTVWTRSAIAPLGLVAVTEILNKTPGFIGSASSVGVGVGVGPPDVRGLGVEVGTGMGCAHAASARTTRTTADAAVTVERTDLMGSFRCG
jgi:hypothetical protein